DAHGHETQNALVTSYQYIDGRSLIGARRSAETYQKTKPLSARIPTTRTAAIANPSRIFAR
ncbi:MAG: hypothetical protein ACLQVX_08155, partial [Limisphaerales bacterium]